MKNKIFKFIICLLSLVFISLSSIAIVYKVSTASNSNIKMHYYKNHNINNKYSAQLLFVGDILIHKWQYDYAKDNNEGIIDFEKSFQFVKDEISNADFAIANLEGTLNNYFTGYPLFAAPYELADAIKSVGFDFVTTANNHSFDKGIEGVNNTIDYLDSINLPHTGTYKSKEDSEKIYITKVNGISIALLNYSYSTNGIPLPKDKPYLVNMIDKEKIAQDIELAKESNVDFIIVLPHMGVEYAQNTNAYHKELVSYIFEQGADAVIASHPHVLQEMSYETVTDKYGKTKDRFVMYSMGNFISSQRTLPRDTSLMLKMNIEKDNDKVSIKSVTYIPTWVTWKDTSAEQYINIISVYDGLNDLSSILNPSDITRLKDIHLATTKKYMSESLPLDEIQEEYIYKKND